MTNKKLALGLTLGLLALALSVGVAYSIDWAKTCNVSTTDLNGNPKGVTTPFNVNEIVYINWTANGQINMTVYQPDGITVDHAWTFLTNNSAHYTPTHGTGIYTIVVPTFPAKQWPLAVGTFEVLPQIPFGTILALVTMIGSVFIVHKIRKP